MVYFVFHLIVTGRRKVIAGKAKLVDGGNQKYNSGIENINPEEKDES